MNNRQNRGAHAEYRPWMAWALAGVLIAGALLAGWTVARADRELRATLLQQARIMAQALNPEQIRLLSATPADLDDANYLALERQLAAARSADPRTRFAYLLGRAKAGEIFFFVDTQDNAVEETPPCQPGEVYPEASDELRGLFETGGAIVEGPLADQWGVWVSALVSLIDPHTGRVIAVLGIDMDARDWQLEVAARAALPVGTDHRAADHGNGRLCIRATKRHLRRHLPQAGPEASDCSPDRRPAVPFGSLRACDAHP
jgi:hypothetical protein